MTALALGASSSEGGSVTKASSSSKETGSDDCSFDGETMTEAASISQLGSCPTLEGTLEISGDGIGSLDLGSVQEIAGDIHIFNSSSCTDINLNQLEKISGKLSVDALTQLHVIDFTKLTEVEALNLISLPSLSTLNLNSGLSKLGDLQVSDTALSSLQGLVTSINTVGQLNVNNNKNITSIDLSNLQSVKENLILSFNGDSCDISLDNLNWASNLTIQDAGSFEASNLTTVNGSFVFGYNKFEDFKLPLEKIGGAVQIFAHDYLTEFSLGNLTEIGGELRIFNNTELDDMSESFEGLETIKGAVNIKGSFSNFTMPSLEEVDGDFMVKSDNEDFDCESFKKLHSDEKIEGHNFKCVAPKKDASISGSASDGAFETETFSGESGSSDGDSDDSDSSSSSEDKATTLIGGGLVAIIFSTILSVMI